LAHTPSRHIFWALTTLVLLLNVFSTSGHAELAVNFTKADFANPALENDCITPAVCLSRGDQGLLCNVATGDVCNALQLGGVENPTGTEWAVGTCYGASEYGPFISLIWWGGGDFIGPPDLVGVDLCLHLTSEDLFYEFNLTSWSALGSGGVSWKRMPAADPNSMITNLVGDVLLLNLLGGIENSLDAKLETAINALLDVNENNDVAACNSLQAFINAVEAQTGNKIPQADADNLILQVLDIFEVLGCP
jgi:hypothetical protein